MDTSARCPCCSGEPFGDCCSPVLQDHARARTALQLMRSRFTAFALDDTEHLYRTWHPETRPAEIETDPALRWNLLEVLDVEAGGPFDRTGTVEFRAHWVPRVKNQGKKGKIQEKSWFQRPSGLWFYQGGAQL